MLVVSVLAMAVLFFVVVYFLAPVCHKWSFQRESERILRNVHNLERARKVVGPLGIVFAFPDGSWIAIRYRDSHGGVGWSKAVAVDSTGQLYESDVHYCGAFVIYRQEKQMWKQICEATGNEGQTDLQFSGLLGQIDALASCPNLRLARKKLVSLGFEPVH